MVLWGGGGGREKINLTLSGNFIDDILIVEYLEIECGSGEGRFNR